MTEALIIQVALPVPRGETYDYLCAEAVLPGSRVQVPFGPRQLIGVVVACHGASDRPVDQLRPVLKVLDPAPLLDRAWLDLLAFAARYYQAPLGFAIGNALPASLRKGKPARILPAPCWGLTPAGAALELDTLRRAPRQVAALQALRLAQTPVRASALSSAGIPPAALKSLASKGLVKRLEAPAEQPAAGASPPTLTAEQAVTVKAISAQSGFACHLLEGVTGSGKTEVYLALARAAVAGGQQCLFLVPEIGLTPQMVARVRAGTGARVAALHSGLADGERHNTWLRAQQGDVDIVLGTRSAVFVPLANPGLIVVDEEHDNSYKQQDGMRYHARDLAVRRAQLLDVPVLLGSATPALESHYNALIGRYQRHRLHSRFGAARQPRLQIVDLRGQRCQDGLSGTLVTKTRQHLEAGQQVLLFINRRGFSPILLCHDCGWTANCSRCDARLISHQRSRSLRCHHCGQQRPLPQQCPDCHSPAIQHLGQGTERIEQRVAALFPEVPRLRLDRDVLQRKGELEAALARIESGEVRLIIGTQMLAKGHDFPLLSLVGIVDADQGLYGQDFRAAEHLAQLITQVAGRAGRRDTAGEVILQTHNPEHPLLQSLAPGCYPQLAESLLNERQMLAWPPFSRIALLRAESANADAALTELSAIAEIFYAIDDLEVLGPVPAVMERKGGRFRFHVLFRSQNRRLLQFQLSRLRQELESRAGARRLRWSIDVDPQILD